MDDKNGITIANTDKGYGFDHLATCGLVRPYTGQEELIIKSGNMSIYSVLLILHFLEHIYGGSKNRSNKCRHLSTDNEPSLQNQMHIP